MNLKRNKSEGSPLVSAEEKSYRLDVFGADTPGVSGAEAPDDHRLHTLPLTVYFQSALLFSSLVPRPSLPSQGLTISAVSCKMTTKKAPARYSVPVLASFYGVLLVHFQRELLCMGKYRRMTWTDRLIIEKLYNKGQSYRAIAAVVGFSVSSVHREIQHGLYEHLGAETTRRPFRYSAQIAQEYADIQATIKGPALKLGCHYEFAAVVEREVKQGRSVSHIVADLRRRRAWTVSVSTLYRYIDCGYIPNVTNRQLPEKGRRKRGHRQVRAKRPPKGTSIERRPAFINDRSVFGHWEMDSVIGKAEGKRQSLVVLTERMTRYQLIAHVRDKSAASVVRALDSALSKFPEGTFKTITVDNGSEFSDCYGMEYDKQGDKRLTVYYCHPYTSCERGSNERANRIIRRFFPKGKSLYNVSQAQCCEVAYWMNTMRRKILDFDTAEERFNRELAKLL